MSETQTAQPFDPYQAAQAGHALQQEHATFLEGWAAAQHPQGAAYGPGYHELETSMSAHAEAIFTATGVQPTGMDLPEKDNNPAGNLGLAVSVAEEASELGFTLEGDDQAAKEQAQRLIDDYDAYTAPLLEDRNAELPADYRARQKAKLLLVESSARDLARRSGIEDPVLDQDTIDHVKKLTGVGFAELRHGYRGPVRLVLPPARPRRKEENPNYAGPVGTTIHVSGLGNAAIVGYRHGKPVIRGADGSLQTTHGRP